MEESLVSELQCPVCLELLNVPIILPCSHLLCRSPCAERLFVDELVKCPVCRDNSLVRGGVESLPRVITIEHIIEQYQNQLPAIEAPPPAPLELCGPLDVPCQLCDAENQCKAVKSCLNCNASYCEQCLKLSHPDRKPFDEHQLVEPKRIPKPKELKCLYHDMLVNIYCPQCQIPGCLLCADDPNAHPGHPILSLEQGVVTVKEKLEDFVGKIQHNQDILRDSIRVHRDKHREFKESVEEKRNHIKRQCDSLINEIETKRDFFLSDIEYESQSKADSLQRLITKFQEQVSGLQSLLYYTQEVMKEPNQCTFLQLAKTVSDRLEKSLELPPRATCPPSPSVTTLHNKVVDFRKEKAILRDLAYLTVPETPYIDVDKCSRSTSSVVVVLNQPGIEYDVIDGYKVYYCSEQQKDRAEWDMMEFKSPGEERKCGRGPPSCSAVCLIHDNLECGTMYYFCVRAYNLSGESEMSDIVNCTTLSEAQSSILPVPEITENQCRTYTYSIQLHSPSPLDVPPDSGISHFLLYRESAANKLWRSISLYGRVDHRVFGLEPDTMYDFVIMACNKNGECQVSNQITMTTERSAY